MLTGAILVLVYAAFVLLGAGAAMAFVIGFKIGATRS